ncbi:hypothetical protein A7A09_013850 [Paracoccus methylarcula]|uniref:Uncharacterized protein n=1 Tax=Paracoccus methylarcula TaxID=72022 RepID=A0A3R7P3V7_9RHOB|nr:hypothetical protein A7A09_013850 [Paracoccus methylarcula]
MPLCCLPPIRRCGKDEARVFYPIIICLIIDLLVTCFFWLRHTSGFSYRSKLLLQHTKRFQKTFKITDCYPDFICGIIAFTKFFNDPFRHLCIQTARFAPGKAEEMPFCIFVTH